MKYLVLECRSGYAVVLSEDGRFLKAANLRYEVGQTVGSIIEVSLPRSQQQPVKTNNRRWVSALTAMAACLVLMVTSFFYGQLPCASVYMAINPEVRIDVNRSDRVVDVEGMNTDGKQLLTGYDLGRKDLDAVMDELVDRAIDMGYLHEGGRITLNLDGSEAWVSSHSGHLNEHLKEHLEETITVTIDVQQKQPETATPASPTAPVGPIVIPVVPDGYDDSDYGEEESDYHADSDYEEAGGDSAYDTDSDYGASDYDDSDYDASKEDSDYGDVYEEESDYAGESEYDTPDSDYAASGNDQSDYGESDYAAPAPVPEESDYGGSDYAEPVPAASDYGDSGYDDPASDYADGGRSNYDQSDYEGSDYDD